jgi:hypothetical protein
VHLAPSIKANKTPIRLEVLATLLEVIMDSIKLPVEASCYNSLPNTVDLPLKRVYNVRV